MNEQTTSRRPRRRSADISVRDPTGSVREIVEAYCMRTGCNFSEAVRELIVKGEEASAADSVRLHELIPDVHMLISELRQRVPKHPDYNRVMLITVLESVMYLRQFVGAVKPDLFEKARQNTREAFDKLVKEGTA
nr:hypothetical protein [Solimonas soli]